jgi:hypothetical protein
VLIVSLLCASPDIAWIGTGNLKLIAKFAFPRDDFTRNLFVDSPKGPTAIITEEEALTHKLLGELEARPKPVIILDEPDIYIVAGEKRPEEVGGGWTEKAIERQVEPSQFGRDYDVQFGFGRREFRFIAGRTEAVAREELPHAFGGHRPPAV